MPKTTDTNINWEELQNPLPGGGVMSNGELLGEFCALSEKDEKTISKYAANLDEFGEWLCKPLLELQRPDIVRFMGYLKSGGRLQCNKHRPKHKQFKTDKLSASSRKSYLSAIRVLWEHFALLDYTDRDPTIGVKAPTVTIQPGLAISADKMRRFLDAPGKYERCRVQAHLLCYTAARVGQLTSLLWSDVDFESKEIAFRDMKGAKADVIPMHAQLYAALLRWRNAQRALAAENPAIAQALADPDRAYVLLTRNGLPVQESTIAKQVKSRAARVGLLPHHANACVGAENRSRLYPHALRRSWARHMREQGTPLEDIAEILNHKSVDTTRRHYAQASGRKKRKTINAFDV